MFKFAWGFLQNPNILEEKTEVKEKEINLPEKNEKGVLKGLRNILKNF